jgi:transposase
MLVVFASCVGMYMRTTQRKNRDGSIVRYYQLAHNVREPGTGKITPKILYNFGRAEEIDCDALVRLCKSIDRVCHTGFRDTTQKQEAFLSARDLPWPEEVKIVGSRELGPVLVIEALWERLGIGSILREIMDEANYIVPYERALMAMTANRLCSPDSKLGVWDRWLPTVFLPSCWALKLPQMYEAMDILYSHRVEVEQKVFFHTVDLLSLEVDLVFYDTTTASFCVDFDDADEKGEIGFRKRGHGKDGDWSPQVVVALAVTREGIPIRSWVFPGNTSDVTTVEKVKSDLREWKLGRCLFVADAGMNSEENRELLAKGCGKYLLAVRAASVKEVREEVLTRPGRFKKIADNLQIKEVEVGDGELRRRYILCFNPKEAKRQKAHREEVIAELTQELDRHRNWDAKAKWAIKLLASQRTSRYLSISSAGKICLATEKIREADKYDGKWVLITNDDTLKVEDAACGYKNLMIIERCFRTLKSTQIHLTPVNHWLPRRIEAHVKICALALLIQRAAELACEKTWSTIRHTLAELQAVEFETGPNRFFRRNEIHEAISEILENLKISMPKPVLEVTGTKPSL